MDAVFLKILNMSITASYLIAAVLVLRLIFKKLPKKIMCLLWALVGIRLICPFSFESLLSIIPGPEVIQGGTAGSQSPSVNIGLPYVNNIINPTISDVVSPDNAAVGSNVIPITTVLAVIWAAGVAAMVIYSVVSYIGIYAKVRESAPLGNNIFICDNIETPFVLGIIRPKIYIPSDTDKSDIQYITAHENAHIKRKDHIWKPLGFMLLSVYWFNPFLWVAYIMLCKDIELACDEKVINETGEDIKKAYSTALINCSVKRKTISACPLAFGGSGVKERVKNILNYKKPAVIVTVLALVSCIVVSACLMTNPVTAIKDDDLALFIDDMITEHHEATYTKDSLVCISTKILKVSGFADKKTVYMIAAYEENVYNGKEIETFNGSITPTVITAEKICGEYTLKEYWEAGMGSDYTDSIKAKFPFYLHAKAIDTSRYAEELCNRNRIKAEKYFGVVSFNKESSEMEYTTVSKDVDDILINISYKLTDVVCKSKNAEDMQITHIEINYPKKGIYAWQGELLLSGNNAKTVNLSKKNFDDLFKGDYDYPTNLSKGQIRKSNSIAWMIDELTPTENGIFPYMFLQQNGDECYIVFAEYKNGKPEKISSIRSMISASRIDDIGNPYFSATILEVHSKSILVKPDDTMLEKYSSDQIEVPLTTIAGSELPELEAGKRVWIVYDGMIAETYPARITNVYAVMDCEDTWTTEVYYYKDSVEKQIKPCIMLNKTDGTFSFSWSALSSYIANGKYTLTDKELTLKTDDGENTYIFTVDGNSFIFNADKSSEIPEYRYSENSEPECPVPDGAVFTIK